MRISLFACGLLLAAAPAFAADVDGHWTGSLDSPQGPVTLAFDLKATGATLTGTNTSPDGMKFPLKNGKIDGDKITFTIDVDLGGQPLTFNYTGVVSPKEIKLHTEFMGQPLDYSIKKT
jgi:hypothetical protein